MSATSHKADVLLQQSKSGNRKDSLFGDASTDADLTPHMNEAELALFAKLLKGATKYFEFGSGGSTVWAVNAKNIKKIHVVENDVSWVGALRGRADVKAAEDEGRLSFSIMEFGNVTDWAYPVDRTLDAQDKWPSYSDQIKLFHSTPWDLILVDGRFRVACVLKALAQIKGVPSAKIVIHDYERPQYHSVETFATVEEQVDRLAVLRPKGNLQVDALEKAAKVAEKELKLLHYDHEFEVSKPEVSAANVLQRQERVVMRQSRSHCKSVANSLCDTVASGRFERKPILITGTGGSGTHSVTSLFRMNGISLAHEAVGEHGSVSWPYAVDVNTSAPNFFEYPECPSARFQFLIPPKVHYEHVFHLVRCPRDVVSSMRSHSTCSLRYIRDSMSMETPDLDLHSIKFFMKAWLQWNLHLEKYAESRYRIDQFAAMYSDVCKRVRVTNCTDSPVLPKRVENQRNHRRMTWRELFAGDQNLAQQLRNKARAYGFPPSCIEDDVDTPNFLSSASDANETSIVDGEDSIVWLWDKATASKLFPNDMLHATVA